MTNQNILILGCSKLVIFQIMIFLIPILVIIRYLFGGVFVVLNSFFGKVLDGALVPVTWLNDRSTSVVSDNMEFNNKASNIPLVSALFDSSDSAKILNTPLFDSVHEDKRVWSVDHRMTFIRPKVLINFTLKN